MNELDEYIASLGLIYNAVFVPQSASGNSDEKGKSLNWHILLAHPRCPSILTTEYAQRITRIPQPPSLRDVLYALTMNADILDCRSFDEWAALYGYETVYNTRIEEIYRACRDTAYRLEALIGRSAVDKLRELFQEHCP